MVNVLDQMNRTPDRSQKARKRLRRERLKAKNELIRINMSIGPNDLIYRFIQYRSTGAARLWIKAVLEVSAAQMISTIEAGQAVRSDEQIGSGLTIHNKFAADLNQDSTGSAAQQSKTPPLNNRDDELRKAMLACGWLYSSGSSV